MRYLLVIFVLALVMLVGACSSSAAPATVPPLLPVPGGAAAPTTQTGGSMLTVTSAAFTDGASIPGKYSCKGESISPPLKWSGAPAQTKSYALIVQDPDAPSGTFYHWVDFNIPASTTQSPEGAQNVGTPGKNGAGKLGYTGPCPPSGTHRYIFNLYALDVTTLRVNEGATHDQVESAIQGHILAQGQLMGRFSK